MTNNEIFFLCVLSGAKEIIGLENALEGLPEEETNTFFEEMSNVLLEKKILSKNEKNDNIINDEFSKIAANISFADTVFELQDEENIKQYIYIKGSRCLLSTKKEDEYSFDMYEDRADIINFLSDKLMITSSTENIKLEISEDSLGEFIEKANTEEITDENLRTAVDAFISDKDSLNFIGYKQNQETPSQALFKAIKTNDGTWIYKIRNGEVGISKCDVQGSISQILTF